jgi:predicted TIM-barrel fold metal-dependent hydrolase
MRTRKINCEDLKDAWVDVHTHTIGIDISNLINFRYPLTQSIVDLQQKVQSIGIDYFVALTMPGSVYWDYATYWNTGKFINNNYGKFPFQIENSYLVKCVNALNISDALPFFSFSLQKKVKEQEEFLIELINSYDIYGLKYHTKVDQKEATCISKESNILDIAKRFNLPIIIHTELKYPCDPLNVYQLAKENPEIRFSAAHVGDFSALFFDAMIENTLNNLYIDTGPLIAKCHHIIETGSPNENRVKMNYSVPSQVFKELNDIFPKNILWSSDEPWTHYGNFDKKPFVKGDFYVEEARLYKNSIFKKQISQNTSNFIFGTDI